MSFFEVEFHDEAFMDWANQVEHSFIYMTQTMIRVAKQIKEEVQMITPVETGKLSRSYRWHIVTDNSRMKVLEVQMSALNPKTGYDYAMTQHKGYRHDKHGYRVWYNHNARELGFFNYEKSWWNKSGYNTSPSLGYSRNNAYEHHFGEREYLKRAIIKEERSAFEIIEKDYLSLFTEGYIL